MEPLYRFQWWGIFSDHFSHQIRSDPAFRFHYPRASFLREIPSPVVLEFGFLIGFIKEFWDILTIFLQFFLQLTNLLSDYNFRFGSIDFWVFLGFASSRKCCELFLLRRSTWTPSVLNRSVAVWRKRIPINGPQIRDGAGSLGWPVDQVGVLTRWSGLAIVNC